MPATAHYTLSHWRGLDNTRYSCRVAGSWDMTLALTERKAGFGDCISATLSLVRAAPLLVKFSLFLPPLSCLDTTHHSCAHVKKNLNDVSFFLCFYIRILTPSCDIFCLGNIFCWQSVNLKQGAIQVSQGSRLNAQHR